MGPYLFITFWKSLIFIGFLLLSLFGGYHLSYFSFRPLVISKFQFLFLFLRSLPGDLSFGILFIWKLHQIHFVFLFIVLGYYSLFYTSLNSSSLLLISIAGKDFTSHRIIFLSLSLLLLGLSLVFSRLVS